MEPRMLGASKLRVAPVGLGGMPMSLSGRPAEADAVKVIHAALDAGMTFIDTADVYCKDHTDIGHNERLIARALAERPERDHIVVATKGGLERPNGAWTTNGRPEHLKKACDLSLAALGTRAIDIYQLHAPDDDVPLADSVGALAELRTAGKVRHVALSNVSVEEIEIARAIVPIVSVQNRCNVFDRSSFANGFVGHCEAHGIAFLPYCPVGGSRQKERVGSHPGLVAVGARHGVSPFQVALAWLLASSPTMIPIPGASKARNAVDSAGAMHVTLTSEDRAELHKAFPI